MHRRLPLWSALVLAPTLFPGAAVAVPAVEFTATETRKEQPMTRHAQGPFDVQLSPQTVDDPDEATFVGRMRFDKQFHGDLEAAGKGVMLYNHSPTAGSGAYVAIETVTGVLHGRSGSFGFQHNCHMTPDGQQQSITVIPGSGTGELAGLQGELKITIVDGAHSYDFHYSLPQR